MPIRYDFRSCLMIHLAYENAKLSQIEKQGILLGWFYYKTPSDPWEGITQAIYFLNQEQEQEGEEGEASPRVFSFEKDSAMIYSAFLQTHNIDLQTAELHWYQFLALFADLHPDTAFCQLRSLRYRLKTGKATREERQTAMEMEDLIYLPELDMRTYEERLKEKRLMDILNHV